MNYSKEGNHKSAQKPGFYQKYIYTQKPWLQCHLDSACTALGPKASISRIVQDICENSSSVTYLPLFTNYLESNIEGINLNDMFTTMG